MARIIGDNTDNQLVGTLEADIIRGLDGIDRVQARGGDDVVRAGAGDDTVAGQRGDDNLRGNAGDDVLKANAGDDRASGGGGKDRVKGGRGSDILKGGAGDDILKGGADDDVLKGGAGDDVLSGDTGSDILKGGAGDDRMIWNPGDGSDIMRGGAGADTAVSNGGDIDEVFTLQQEGRRALFDRVDPFPFNLNIAGTETVEVNGFGGNDSFEVGDLSATEVTQVVYNAGDGNDTLDAAETNVRIVADGGTGDDTLTGGDADDLLQGGDGNDVIDGDRGDDTMLGGGGDDRLIWNPGGGSDVMVGGEGFDTAVANGGDVGEQFTLEQNGNQAIFNRVDPFPFSLTITESEKVEVNGNGGDDSFVVSDVTSTDVVLVYFDGGTGNDNLDAADAEVAVEALGRAGDDTLTGGRADDTLTGGAGVDVLTGGAGRDRFVYGSNALGTTDSILDFETANDQYVLNGEELGIEALAFEQGFADDLQLNSNVIVLTDQSFANAKQAAEAIANGTTTVEEGVFIYFNESLGIGRLVHSQDLGGGGEINALANMENITQVSDLANFSNNNFALA